MKKDKVTRQKLDKYFKITEKALSIIKKKAASGKKKQADEIIEMVSAYLSDAQFFKKKGDLVNSLASLSYAYGWIDCGARLGVFKVKDRKLFTV